MWYISEYMETTTTITTKRNGRTAAINALAVVGFIALVFIGIALAIYAARYVPTALSRVGSAAVYLGSVFTPADEDADLEVVPGETIPFDEETPVATSTPATGEPTTQPTTNTPRPTPTQGQTTTGTYPVGGTVAVPQAPYGKADLAVSVVSVGYLNSADTDSYRVSSEVPDGKRGAIKFVVTNVGTNVTGSWKFKATLPTSPSYTFTSPSQKSLNPGDKIEFVLGFDKTKEGNNRTIEIVVDSGKDVSESNENNNEVSKTIDIEK